MERPARARTEGSRRSLAAWLLGLVAICGCGTPTSTTSGTSQAPTEATQSPEATLRDAAAALRATSSYHLSGIGPSDQGRVSVDLRVRGDGGFSGTLSIAGSPLQLVVVGGQTYARGKAYFASHGGGSLADLIGDRWVRVPGSPLGASLALTDPKQAAACLLADHETLRRGALAQVGGHAAIVIIDLGDAPGTRAGRLSVALDAPHYPLRIERTGAPQPGQPPGGDHCRSVSTASVPGGTSDFRLDSFGSVAAITPPPDPLDLGGVAGQPSPAPTPSPG